MRITKKQVLEGIKARRTVEIPEMDGEFVVRPMTDGEFADMQSETNNLSKEAKSFFQKHAKKSPEEIEQIILANPDMQTITTVDDIKSLKQATYIAAAAGLSCDGEKWTIEDVRQMAPGVPDKLAKVILEMTTGDKGGQTNAARTFCPEPGGADDNPPE